MPMPDRPFPINHLNVYEYAAGIVLVIVTPENVVRGFIIHRPEGWQYRPHTSARRGSRKSYPLPMQACRRYVRMNETIHTRAQASEAGLLRQQP